MSCPDVVDLVVDAADRLDDSNTMESNLSKNVTRLLQHSILQLCNEHVAYNSTLQVLGVLCMTVDDKPHELIVKLNNTLKRVTTITPPKQPVDQPILSNPAQLSLLRFGGVADTASTESSSSGTDVPAQTRVPFPTFYLNGNPMMQSPDRVTAACSGVANHLPEERQVDEEREGSREDRAASSDRGDNTRINVGASDSTNLLRRMHGRKQTKPIRVKHVFDEGENGGTDGTATFEGDEVLTIEPMDPDSHADCSTAEEENGMAQTTDQPASPLSLCEDQVASVPSCKRLKKFPTSTIKRMGKPGELFVTPSESTGENYIMSSSSTVRALLAKRAQVSEGHPNEFKSEDGGNDFSAQPIVIEPNGENGNCSSVAEMARPQPQFVGGTGTQDVALNFSLGALNRLLPSSSSAASANSGILSTVFSSTPQSFVQNGLIGTPSGIPQNQLRTFYPGFEFLLNANGYTTANIPGFNGATFVTLGGSQAGCGLQTNSDGTVSLIGLRPGGNTMPANHLGLNFGSSTSLNQFATSLSSSSRLPSSSFTLSNPLRTDRGLSLPLSRRRLVPGVKRIRSRKVGSIGQSMKVKDIIMYDESAPLHTQRGSKIEGDFLLDSLNVEGKKRRRRTAEDTLTGEEIAEYMGASSIISTAMGGPAGGSGIFRCRYCADVSSDLSRYFAHTLAAHSAYICHQCGKSFTTKSSLLRHRPIHTGMRRFACSICRKAFYRKDKCKAHIKRHFVTSTEGGSTAADDGNAVVTEGNATVTTSDANDRTTAMLPSPPPQVQVFAS